MGIAVLLSAFVAQAQVPNNTALVCTVTDPSGQVDLSKVTGVNRDTKVVYAGTTNAKGYYSIPFVNPGNYDVAFEMSGLKRQQRPTWLSLSTYPSAPMWH